MTGSPSLPPGYRLAAFDTIGSTNDEAKRLAAAGASEGTVVWARTQTLGRGRQDRTWQSPAGNLYCSIVVRPMNISAPIATLGFVAALAAAQSVEQCAPVAKAGLKWPNDVLLDGRKVAGILLEAGGNGTWVVVGCGINLAFHPDRTPFPATSVAAASGITVAAEEALAAFCRIFDLQYRRWREEGFEPIRQAWLGRAHPVGTPLSVRLPTASLTGSFQGLDREGVLLLEADDGTLHRIAAGDVYFAPTKSSAAQVSDR